MGNQFVGECLNQARVLLQENLYQLGLLTHLQCPDVPLKSARVLRDLKLMYEVAQVDDLQDAYREVQLQAANALCVCPCTLSKSSMEDSPPNLVSSIQNLLHRNRVLGELLWLAVF